MCEHEMRPPLVKKKKKRVVSMQMILVLFQLVYAMWSVIKQMSDII